MGRRKSLTRIAVYSSILVFGGIVLVLIQVARTVSDSSHAAVDHFVKEVGRVVTDLGRLPILTFNYSALEQLRHTILTQDPNIVDLQIFDASGTSMFSEAFPDSAKKAYQQFGQIVASQLDTVRFEVLGDQGEKVGTVVLLYHHRMADQMAKSALWEGAPVAAGILILVVGILIYQLRRFVIQPIDALVQVTREVAQGNLQVRSQVATGDQLEELGNSFNAMIAHLEESLAEIEKEKQRSVQKAEEAAQRARNEVLAQQEYLEQQVERINRLLEAVQRNDLTQRLEPQRDDPIGQLILMLNTTLDTLSEVVRSIRERSGKMTEQVATLEKEAQQTVSSLQHTTADIVEIAAGANEMATTFTSIKEAASQTAAAGQESLESAKAGKEAVAATFGEMEQAQKIAARTQQVMEQLSQSAQEIGKIISIIREIADQTSLLSLNAAIEAARAGEIGRGFAVVADEVRRLAERTQEATKSIETMINDVQAAAKAAMEAAMETSERTASGIELARKANAALESIVESSEQLSSLIQQISLSVDDLSATVENISQRVEQASAATQQNTRSVEHMLTIFDQIAEEVGGLQTETARFVVAEQKKLPSRALAASEVDRVQ